MEDREYFFTQEGLEKTEKELDQLKSEGRTRIAQEIKEALAYGDLSENAEYDHAKNEQAKLEEKIARLENMISNATVIVEDEMRRDIVNIGSRVVVTEKGTDNKEFYTIVGSAETDPLEGKISNESPMGSALIGCKVGDLVSVGTPAGQIEFEVLEIEI